MSNRIDDQILRDKVYADKQESARVQTKKADFARDFKSQQVIQKDETTKQPVKNKTTTTAPTTPQALKASPKKGPEQKALKQKTDTKKTTAKKSEKAEDEGRLEKKRSDLSLDDAVRKKHQSDEDKGGFGESDAFFQQAAALGTQSLSTPTQTQGTSPSLPREVINQLVDHIYSSINTEGLKELTIELKEGVLSGAQIQLSTKDGKVRLHFKSDDPQTRSLLRNSKEALADRLEEKNLSLSEFSVD